MNADHWDRAFTTLDPYCGVNGNMHAVEALHAATDTTTCIHTAVRNHLTVNHRVR
jgi:mannose/cellobiose epimerase-like protein (N-acyl-D-glucosamine 2-epimerase family)